MLLDDRTQLPLTRPSMLSGKEKCGSESLGHWSCSVSWCGPSSQSYIWFIRTHQVPAYFSIYVHYTHIKSLSEIKYWMYKACQSDWQMQYSFPHKSFIALKKQKYEALFLHSESLE
jgi:hypothetical protein